MSSRQKIAVFGVSTALAVVVTYGALRASTPTAPVHRTQPRPVATATAATVTTPPTTDREICTLLSGYQNGVPDTTAASRLMDRLWGLYEGADVMKSDVFTLHNSSPGHDTSYTRDYFNASLAAANDTCAANDVLR